MYADDICLLASASAMQYLLDICYDYAIEHNIISIPTKSVCILFKPNSYLLYLPTVFIGFGALKYVSDSKYLGLSFCDSKSNDIDMLRKMRSLYAKSNKLLRPFGHYSTNVKFTLFQSYCTTLYCPILWNSYKKSTFNKIRVAYNNVNKKYLIFLRRAVLVRCMLDILFAVLNQCYGKAYMALCRD